MQGLHYKTNQEPLKINWNALAYLSDQNLTKCIRDLIECLVIFKIYTFKEFQTKTDIKTLNKYVKKFPGKHYSSEISKEILILSKVHFKYFEVSLAKLGKRTKI